MKLNKTKILEICRLWNEGWSAYRIRKMVGVSERRVYQVLEYYWQTGELPVVGKRMGRPARQSSAEEVKIVLEAYKKYRFSASLLEPIIERDYEIRTPHNRIHQILLNAGLAHKLDKEVIRKKSVTRYERDHSLSLGHKDWHQRPNDGIWVCALEDDASRFLTAMVETEDPTTEASIQLVEQTMEKYGKFKQIITDHGSQFTCNHPGFTDSSQYEQYLNQKGIQHIKCRPKHPQTNGKIEKLIDTIKTLWKKTGTFEKAIKHYNHKRPHRSLTTTKGKLRTPHQAFLDKMRK